MLGDLELEKSELRGGDDDLHHHLLLFQLLWSALFFNLKRTEEENMCQFSLLFFGARGREGKKESVFRPRHRPKLNFSSKA